VTGSSAGPPKRAAVTFGSSPTTLGSNSGLGRAITYFLRHWEPLTLFLRKAGTPLDNNITERALKKAIRHRKNSLFFKTLTGARVGDTFMSLIHTCELSDADPFDYLTELLRHRDELKRAPQDWMPWNYRRAIDRSVLPPVPLGDDPPT
jgi:transposase